MDKNLQNLELSFNRLEKNTLWASHMYGEDLGFPIHADKANANLAPEFNHLMSNISKLYGKKFTLKILLRFKVVTLPTMKKLIPMLKKKFKHSQYTSTEFLTDGVKTFKKQKAQYVRFDKADGSMVDFDSIRYENIRSILNLFRIALHIPISKNHLYYELINDLNLSESAGFDDAQLDGPSGSWDPEEIKMDDECATDDYQSGIKVIAPLILQLSKLSKDKHSLYQLTAFNRQYHGADADYPWVIKNQFQPISHSNQHQRAKLPKGQFNKNQVIKDLITRPVFLLKKYYYIDDEDDLNVCRKTGNGLLDDTQDLLDVVNDDTNRFGKDKKGHYYPITYYYLNSHDVKQLRNVYSRIKNIPNRIDHWAKKIDVDGTDHWDDLYAKENKVVKLLKDCHFHNPKIMKHLANVFDCIKHHDIYNDSDNFYNNGYYYAYNVRSIVNFIQKILNEQRA